MTRCWRSRQPGNISRRCACGAWRPDTKKPARGRFLLFAWWAVQGSNLRPLPCEGESHAQLYQALPEVWRFFVPNSCQLPDFWLAHSGSGDSEVLQHREHMATITFRPSNKMPSNAGSRKHGRWNVRIRRKGLPPLSRSFSTKSAAEAWARATEASIEAGTWKDDSEARSTSLRELLSLYGKKVVPTKKGRLPDEARIRTLMADPLSRYTLSHLDTAALARWRDARLRAGAKGSTVNRELNLISSVINWARKDLMIEVDNPVAHMRRPKNPPGRDRRLEPGEEERLLAALVSYRESRPGPSRTGDYARGTRNRFIKPIVQLALETAMRQGEILELRWEHVDVRKRIAFLPSTKNGDSRTVPLSSRAIAVFDSLTPQSEGRVFPISADALKRAWKRATANAGLEDLRFHDLRHEATSRLAEKLPNVIELSAVTGHKDLKMLKRYYHPRAEALALKLG